MMKLHEEFKSETLDDLIMQAIHEMHLEKGSVWVQAPEKESP